MVSVADDILSNKLQAEAVLTIDDAVTIARRFESAKRAQTVVRGQTAVDVYANVNRHDTKDIITTAVKPQVLFIMHPMTRDTNAVIKTLKLHRTNLMLKVVNDVATKNSIQEMIVLPQSLTNISVVSKDTGKSCVSPNLSQK